MKNSLKSKIRYWWLFLRLAHQVDDPSISRNLRNSASLYATWGDYNKGSFVDWWKKHSQLFREVSVTRVLTTSDTVPDTDFVVAIPFSMSPTAVGKMVANMYRKEQSLRKTETKPKSGKTKKVYGGQFSLTSPEYQVAQFAYYYEFASKVYVPIKNKYGNVKSRDLLISAKDVFGKLKKKTTEVREVPFTKRDANPETETKQIRRYKHYAQELLKNVSQGIFPGEYELKATKTAAQVKQETEERKSKRSVTTPKFRRGAKLKVGDAGRRLTSRDNPFNPFSERKKRKDAGVKRKKS
jgi:hypothetical protein